MSLYFRAYFSSSSPILQSLWIKLISFFSYRRNLVSIPNTSLSCLKFELFLSNLAPKSTYGPYSVLTDSSKRRLNLFNLASIGSLINDFNYSQKDDQEGSKPTVPLSDNLIIVLNYLSCPDDTFSKLQIWVSISSTNLQNSAS